MGFLLPSGRVYDFVPSVRLAELNNSVFWFGHPNGYYRLSEKFIFSNGSPFGALRFQKLRFLIRSSFRGFPKGKNIFS